MEQWDVEQGGGCCLGSGRTLAPGEEYYAALVANEDRFVRRDYSCQYWDEHHPEVFSFWKTRVPEPNQKKKLFVDDEVLINFFERLAGENEPLRINFRFVLALILMRKRLLKYERTQRQGQTELWVMRRTGTTETHEVVNPSLQDEQIEEVSNELGSILRGEL